MAFADSDFIFGADHASLTPRHGFLTFNLEFLVAVVEGCAESGHHHCSVLPPRSGPRTRLSGAPVAEVDGSDVKVVGIGVRFTGKDFADHESAKPLLCFPLPPHGHIQDPAMSARR